MGNAELGVKFVTIGFKPSEIRPRKMWTRLQEDFIEIYNDYCEVTNSVIDQLNQAWKECHPETEEDESKEMTPEEAQVKDLQDQIDNWEYGAFMRDAFDQAVYSVNQKHPDSYLSGYVFMDGPTPVFGARIKQHPEMVITMALEEK